MEQGYGGHRLALDTFLPPGPRRTTRVGGSCKSAKDTFDLYPAQGTHKFFGNNKKSAGSFTAERELVMRLKRQGVWPGTVHPLCYAFKRTLLPAVVFLGRFTRCFPVLQSGIQWADSHSLFNDGNSEPVIGFLLNRPATSANDLRDNWHG